MVALVTDKKGVVYEGAFGVADVSSGRPLKTDAMFRIASMTKPITSVALMQLVEQGKISLDDPAEKYLPELKNPKVITSFDAKTGDYQLRPASKPATVRNFLTHTSGLAYGFTSEIWRDFKPKAGEVYAFGGPMLFDPGERWHYSTSTDVSGRLVEVVSGQKLEEYFHDHIFVPLKMNDTSYNVPESKGPRLVAQQQRDGAKMDGPVVLQIPPLVGLTVANPIGGGGLASTADDYGRFMRMILNGGELDGARVLKAETVKLMEQNQIGAVTRAGAQERHAAQRRLHLHRRRARQMGARLPDHGRSASGHALAGLVELGRHQQHLLLDRPGARHRRHDHDAISAVRRRQGARRLSRLRARRLSARQGGAIDPAEPGAPTRCAGLARDRHIFFLPLGLDCTP